VDQTKLLRQLCNVFDVSSGTVLTEALKQQQMGQTVSAESAPRQSESLSGRIIESLSDKPEHLAAAGLVGICFLYYMAYWLLHMMFAAGVCLLIWGYYHHDKLPETKDERRRSLSNAQQQVVSIFTEIMEPAKRRASSVRNPE
jgi:ABC-type bacteriocin/lantibiotic exporter with double-glycine peptidase domain